MPRTTGTPNKKTAVKAAASNPTTDISEALNFDIVVEAVDAAQPSDEILALRAELAAAKEQLASRASAVTSVRPKSDSELTPEELEIRDLRDQLARAKGKDIDKAEEVYEENTEGGILVHFLEDGISSNGRNFYRGQEVTFGEASYADTVDRNGNSWINLSDEEQFARWGTVKFRKGPWPGRRTYEEESLQNVSISEQAPLVNI